MKILYPLVGIAIITSLLVVATPAQDIKWGQPPNMIDGFNVISSFTLSTDVVIADDWQCNSPQPITHVRWWGSYAEWMEDTDGPVSPPSPPSYFRISWHEYTHPVEFWSMPDNIILEENCYYFDQIWYGAVPNWETGAGPPWEHEFQFDQDLTVPWEQQEGYYYFINIQAVFEEDPGPHIWGWKNCEINWNDDAVRSIDIYPFWEPMEWPIGHRLTGSMDMAFELWVGIIPTPTPTLPKPTPTSSASPSPPFKPTPSLSPTPKVPETPTPPDTPPKTPTPSPTSTNGLVSPTAPVRTPTPTPQSPPAARFHTDYNGDGTSDIAIFRQTSGLWAIRGISRVYWGRTSDKIVPGDYNGDGTTDIGIFRSSSGLWALRGVSRIFFGRSSDAAVPGDFNGDNTWDIGIFRLPSGLWAVRGLTRCYFGATGDIPVAGYYAGNNTRDIGIFRASSGLWAIRGFTRCYFGAGSDIPEGGDYCGDGDWDITIFRPTNGLWAIRGVSRCYFGSSSDLPVPADYQGRGKDDIAIFRGRSGLWAVRGLTRCYFGATGDIPATR